MTSKRLFAALFAFTLLAASCGSSDDSDSGSVGLAAETPDATDNGEPDPTPTDAPVQDEQTTGPVFSDEGRSIDAGEAAIVVDGDAADWADVDGLDMTLSPIGDEAFDPKQATLKVAHDADYVYALVTVEDDYNWNPDEHQLSAALAVQWAIEPSAGEAMGATDADRETSLGMVDIWHWELGSAAGEDSGGAVSGPGEGNDPGNDDASNFDDEYAVHTEDREDDNGAGAENSLLGVWSHSALVADADGTWTFEMRRPLDTGDDQDAQFEVGSAARVAVAYWDVDSGGPEGWEDEDHVQSANQGWITVNFV